MSDIEDSTTTPNCNCTKSLLAVKTLRSDVEVYKVQILIVLCLMATIVVLLTAVVSFLIYWVRKLQRIVSSIDPMDQYKKVGSSTYIKRAKLKNSSSISSSFRHFIENDGYIEPEDSHRNSTETLRKNNSGTLDKNFFTRSNFSFQNPMSWGNNTSNKDGDNNCMENNTSKKNNSAHRKKSNSDAMSAVGKLDKVLY